MSTEIPGSNVRILTAFSVNIHKRKKAFSLLNAWVWHKKKEPPFYLGLRLLEMFIAISETIARPENNAKNSELQNVSSCRKRIKNSELLFCVIFGVCYQNSISRRYLCSASCQVGSFSNPFSVSFSLLMRLLDGRFAFAGYWSELTGDTLTFP